MNRQVWVERISVVLCTYNGQAFLAEQLDSLLAQTRLPDEIVISDDGSQDATWDLLQAFVPRATHRGIDVLLYRQPTNLGYVGNFSDALARSSGDLLFLSDQDDIWLPEKLERMAAAFAQAQDLLLLHTDATLVDGDGKALGQRLLQALRVTPGESDKLQSGRGLQVVVQRSVVTGAAAALRRSLLSCLPVGEGWVHDEWLAFMAAVSGGLRLMPEPLICYRLHGGNQIGVALAPRTWRDKWRDLVMPRRAVLDKEVRRLRALQQALGRAGITDEWLLALIDRRLTHFRRRLAIGAEPMPRRLGSVFSEWLQGRYTEFGTGCRSALRDLLRRD